MRRLTHPIDHDKVNGCAGLRRVANFLYLSETNLPNSDPSPCSASEVDRKSDRWLSGIQRQSLNEKTLGFGRPFEHENPKETCVSTRADIRPENAESSTVIIIIVTFPETNTFRQPI